MPGMTGTGTYGAYDPTDSPYSLDTLAPSKRRSQRLFRYLGIQDPGDRRAFRMAAQGGQLGQYFADRPSMNELFGKLMTAPGDAYSGRKARRFGRMQNAAQYWGTLGQYNPGALPPPTVTPVDSKPPNTPGSPGTAPGAGPAPGAPMTIEDMLKRLGGYMGPTGQATGQFIQNRLGGGLDLPSFENMFQNLLAVHNREGNKNIAALNEAMGSRGARYGSDILNAQADMRRQQTQDLAAQADQLALALGQQQQGMIGQQLQAAQLEQQARENAMSRMFQEYLMQSQLPPIFQSMIGALSGLPQRDTLSYIS